jgi:hypothetical protein
MFCDGVCEKDGKKCGHYITLTMHDSQTTKTENVDLCRFQAMLDSLFRMEKNHIGIQAAVESQRNEEVKTGKQVATAVDTGFRRVAQATKESIVSLQPEKKTFGKKLLSLVKGDT